MVNNEELTQEQQLKIKEFLLKEENLFAQSLENLDHINAITHSINTGSLPISRIRYAKIGCGGFLSISHICCAKIRSENEKLLEETFIQRLFELIEVLPVVRNDAVRQIKKAQESAKRKHDQNLQHIEELKKGNLILVYKAS
ncbi:9073_t:CDS:2 [Dentiscutata erythropus]|uniref:9073_t:CDS:1 n=1 Tax=Dentiscutata erythropus TaxID=1348616 RepID=A0A9N9GR48_9GLOM|nr:9073_t:CDS:2 [Dentiscutata erythropus]